MKCCLYTAYIYSIKLELEIAYSGPGNFRGDKTVYITTHEYLIKYSDVVHYPEGISPAYAIHDDACAWHARPRQGPALAGGERRSARYGWHKQAIYPLVRVFAASTVIKILRS